MKKRGELFQSIKPVVVIIIISIMAFILITIIYNLYVPLIQKAAQ